ncbi:glycosyltransferase family 2 protein [Cohnella sp. GCM10020058]|uniref:glycosyltransferase family 2 protein n=1 Tax=Cohnella sp. GCM10020058 TaxID=3317330 RepID=UPI00363A9883
MDGELPRLSVVIPVYNESGNLSHALRVISGWIEKAEPVYELILVDDGSSDNSWEELERIALSVPNLHMVRLSRNFGKELALCAGLMQARGEAVIVMDGDLQHPPDLIPEMVRLWRQEHYDIVECVKIERGKESFVKKLGASIFYKTLNSLTGFNLKNASDFKLLSSKALEAWKLMPERNTFFRGMTVWTGFRRAQLHFSVPPRSSGNSRWSILRLSRLAVEAVVSFSTIPLRLVSTFGMLFFVGAVVLGLYTLWQKLSGIAVTGFTTVIILLLFIGSMIMIFLGIIGEYIAAIYHETKGRPRYLISEIESSSTMIAAAERRKLKNEAAASNEIH